MFQIGEIHGFGVFQWGVWGEIIAFSENKPSASENPRLKNAEDLVPHICGGLLA